MVLGNMNEVSGRFGNVLTCEKKENVDLKELLDNAILELEGNYEEVEIETIEDVENEIKVISANDEVKNFSFTLVDDEVYYREDSVMIAYPFSDKDSEKIKDYIELTEALKEVIRVQKEDYSDEEIKQAQEKLNEVYDNFSKKHQFINSRQNNRYDKLGLKIDDDGNFYDPLEKDLDNDGIADRYDNDFRDSDYLESTFDIDEKEKFEKKESTLGMISKFKESIESKNNRVESKQEKEYER